MGFAVPAAMGAKVGQPDKRVVAIDGDGCFQMTAQELATSATEKIPFVTAILNNGYLGMVRQWQELFFDERYSGVWLDPNVPDYVKLAEAYGAVGLRVDSPDEVDNAIEKAYSVTDRSVVIDFRVDPGEMVFPMVPSGASNDDIIVGPESDPADDRPGGGTDRMNGATLHTISVLVEDRPGVLTRVAGLFAARGYNIDSLAVGPTEADGISRMTIVVNVDESPLEQVTKQLNKLINVIKILEHDPGTAVERELMLVKVHAEGDARARIMELADVFRVGIVDVTATTLTVEASGGPEKLEALRELLGEFGIVELSRTGRIALARGERGIRERVLKPAKAG